MLRNVLPEILSKFRREHGLTQEAAADRARVSTLTWHRWETGKSAPNGNQLESLAAALELTPDELGLMLAKALGDHYQSRVAATDASRGDATAEPARPPGKALEEPPEESPEEIAERALRRQQYDNVFGGFVSIIGRMATLTREADVARHSTDSDFQSKIAEYIEEAKAAAVEIHSGMGVLKEIADDLGGDEE